MGALMWLARRHHGNVERKLVIEMNGLFVYISTQPVLSAI